MYRVAVTLPTKCIISPVVYLDATQTGPTPVTWAPTCRTRQPRSLCPGWRLAEAEESELNQRSPSAPWIQQQSTSTLCYYMFQSVLASFSWSCKLTPPPHPGLKSRPWMFREIYFKRKIIMMRILYSHCDSFCSHFWHFHINFSEYVPITWSIWIAALMSVDWHNFLNIQMKVIFSFQ